MNDGVSDWRGGIARVLDAILAAAPLRDKTQTQFKSSKQFNENGAKRRKCWRGKLTNCPRTKKSSLVANGTLSDAMSEAVAQAQVKAGDFSLASVLKVLRCVDVPENFTRTNVMPEGKDSVFGMLLGLYEWGSFGITKQTIKKPWLTRLLVGAIRSAVPHFHFTSIQVNYDYASKPHVDKSNLGDSYIVSLGNHSGGQLWVHDDTGAEPYELGGQDDVSSFYRVGSVFRGRRLQVHDTWVAFDGNKLHFTMPFEGERYSIIWFTKDRFANVPEDVRIDLRLSGFDFDWAELDTICLNKCEERRKAAKQKEASRLAMREGRRRAAEEKQASRLAMREQRRSVMREDRRKYAEQKNASRLAMREERRRAWCVMPKERRKATQQNDASRIAMREGRHRMARTNTEAEKQSAISRGRCIGRIWADGWGLRCAFTCADGSDLCGSHITRDRWKTHGRMDGDVPAAKAVEMAKVQRSHIKSGRWPPVTSGATILIHLPGTAPFLDAD